MDFCIMLLSRMVDKLSRKQEDHWELIGHFSCLNVSELLLFKGLQIGGMWR